MGQQQKGEGELRRVAALVEKLLSNADSTIYFVGKWHSIRARLEQISTGLSIAVSSNAGSSHSVGDSVLRELLQCISSTVAEAEELARFCKGDEPYTAGKLLMRSNLDLVASKFDLHVKSLAGIYTSGILASPSKALVMSKPVLCAGREEMRFYLKDLFTRLRIGDSEMKGRALAALVEVFREDEKYVRIVVSEMSEILNLLSSLVDSRDLVIQEGAAEAISAVSGIDFCKTALVLASVVSPLVRLLEKGSELGKETAARALKKLTVNSDNAWSVSANGGVTLLLELCNGCSNGRSSIELVGNACGVLRNLLGVGEIRRFMVEEGAVPVFLKMLRSKEEALQIHAMEFLQSISSEEPEAKIEIFRGGGVESLLQVIDPNSTSSSKAKEMALRTAGDLSLSSTNNMNLLMGSGFFERVLLLLRNGEVSVQESALKLLSRLCVSSEDAKKLMGEVGFMPELVKLLDVTRSMEMREMAAKTLSCVMSVHKNQKRFIQEDHQNISRILEVLNKAEEKPLTKKFLLNALMSLSGSNSGRRKINESGYVKSTLERLAETDVADAKRIVKKLSENRIKGFFLGIWNPSP